MKKISIMLVIICLGLYAQAQSVAEQHAGRIAQRMKDTLSLNETQRQQIYEINLRLATQKQAARSASSDRDQVGRQLQHIENTRDGLYQPILGEEKFPIYKMKKKNLVNGQ
ncbi:hypothetical protein LZZ85_04040 [Terrimonas sp. NA20]|uniref:Uncharacterized protein n=1 Tax=Terrimonas ginsenosidimutans TaxID=2908004 RepID=A0ABS9KM90_9BACT|nr:hypothetical protein [Terrimonas ginsenosidimutans]MCG2613433.1 hypothetical protein [Terrimonas ginsenosidimutans]